MANIIKIWNGTSWQDIGELSDSNQAPSYLEKTEHQYSLEWSGSGSVQICSISKEQSETTNVYIGICATLSNDNEPIKFEIILGSGNNVYINDNEFGDYSKYLRISQSGNTYNIYFSHSSNYSLFVSIQAMGIVEEPTNVLEVVSSLPSNNVTYVNGLDKWFDSKKANSDSLDNFLSDESKIATVGGIKTIIAENIEFDENGNLTTDSNKVPKLGSVNSTYVKNKDVVDEIETENGVAKEPMKIPNVNSIVNYVKSTNFDEYDNITDTTVQNTPIQVAKYADKVKVGSVAADNLSSGNYRLLGSFDTYDSKNFSNIDRLTDVRVNTNGMYVFNKKIATEDFVNYQIKTTSLFVLTLEVVNNNVRINAPFNNTNYLFQKNLYIIDFKSISSLKQYMPKGYRSGINVYASDNSLLTSSTYSINLGSNYKQFFDKYSQNSREYLFMLEGTEFLPVSDKPIGTSTSITITDVNGDYVTSNIYKGVEEDTNDTNKRPLFITGETSLEEGINSTNLIGTDDLSYSVGQKTLYVPKINLNGKDVETEYKVSVTNYLTEENAADLRVKIADITVGGVVTPIYAPLGNFTGEGLDAYLTTSEAIKTYLSKEDATTTYATIATTDSLYGFILQNSTDISALNNNFEEKSSIAKKTRADASGNDIEETYLTKLDASNTYLNKTDASTTYSKKSYGVYYVEGNIEGTAGEWTGTNKDITEYYDGLVINYKIGIAGDTTTTLNINSLGAKTCYLRGTTKLANHYPVGTMLLLSCNATTDAFYSADYDTTNGQFRQYYTLTTSNAEYPIVYSYTTATGTSSYKTTYGAVEAGFTYNPSTGTLSSVAFKENGKLLSEKYVVVDSKATASKLGLVKASAVRTSAVSTTQGGTTEGRYYGVELDSNGKMFVNVPWTDTVGDTDLSSIYLTKTEASNTYATKATVDIYGQNIQVLQGYFYQGLPKSAFTGVSVSGTKVTFTKGDGTTIDITTQDTNTNTTYDQATSDKLGLVKIGYSENGKNYPVELNSSGQMYVNVPWTDTNTTTLPTRLAESSTSGYDDANKANIQGWHYMSSTATNRPPFKQVDGQTGNDYRIMTTAYGSTWMQQIATDFRSNDVFTRRCQNGTWQGWTALVKMQQGLASPVGTDNAIARWDATRNATIQDSKVTIDDNGNMVSSGQTIKVGASSKNGQFIAYNGSNNIVFGVDSNSKGYVSKVSGSGTTAYTINFPEKDGTLATIGDMPDVSGYLPTKGGTVTGTITMTAGDMITRYTAVKDAGHETTSTYGKIVTLSTTGYIRYRTPAEILSDIGATTEAYVDEQIDYIIDEELPKYKLKGTTTTVYSKNTGIYTSALAAGNVKTGTITLTSSVKAGDRLKVYVNGGTSYPTMQAGIIELELTSPTSTTLIGNGSFLSVAGGQRLIIGAEINSTSSATTSTLKINVYTLAPSDYASASYVYVYKVERIR